MVKYILYPEVYRIMTLNEYEIRQIIQMRGLGYTQQEIAERLRVSRKTVENHLRRLRLQAEEAEEEDDLENLFWGTLLTLGAAAVLAAILNNQQRGGRNR